MNKESKSVFKIHILYQFNHYSASNTYTQLSERTHRRQMKYSSGPGTIADQIPLTIKYILTS